MHASRSAPRGAAWAICLIAVSGFWVSQAHAQKKFPLPKLPDAAEQPYATTDYKDDLLDLNGKDVRFSRFKGKVLFLHFWATWCGICLGELPSIQRLWKTVGGEENIAFALVSKDDGSDAVRKLMKTRKFDFPVYLREGRLGEFSAGDVPVTYIVDRDGKILLRHSGAAACDDHSVSNYLLNLANAKGAQR